MKHLKTYKKLFESASLDINDWLDVKDIIQSEILDKYHISTDSVTDSQEGSKYRANDPVLTVKYTGHQMSMDIMPIGTILADIYKLNRRVKELTGHFIIATNNVNSSKENIEIKLSKTPDNRITINNFNLKVSDTDNTIDRKPGGMCDYETAVKILEWLNTFYTFCYRTEFEAFKLAYDTLCELYNVQIVFSLPRFEDERFKQVVCFQFILSQKVEKGPTSKVYGNKYPIFIINTNHTESPQIRKRLGGHNWVDIPFNKRERYIDFLKTEQF
jgi:hypothetical protein